MRPVQVQEVNYDELVAIASTNANRGLLTEEETPESWAKNALKSICEEKADEELKELAVNVDKKTLLVMQEVIPRERIDKIAIEEAEKIIDVLSNYDGLKIELKGTWVWVRGNTKAHKEVLKMLKLGWCTDKVDETREKSIWAWKHPLVPQGNRRPQSMRRIDRRYGTQRSVVGADPIPDED